MYLKVWQRHFTSFFSLLLYIYMYILFPVCIFFFIQFTGRASVSIIIIFEKKKTLNVINFKNIMPQDTSSIEGRIDSLIRLILRVYFFLFLFLRSCNLCTFYYFIYCHLPFWFFPISLIQRVGERNSYM